MTKKITTVIKYIFLVLGYIIFQTNSAFNAQINQNVKEVTLLTLNWPPYIGYTLPKKGYVYILVKEIFKTMNYKCNIKFCPWTRVIDKAKKGEVDGYFPEYYSPKLKKYFLISHPFPGGPIVFLALKNRNIKYKELSDLKKYRIGLVKGYINTDAIDNASYLHKDWARDDLINIKKLLKKRVDLIVIDKYVAHYLIKKYFPDKLSKVKILLPIIEHKDLYVCFSKKNKRAKILVQDFNKGLALLKQNGELNKIIKEWKTELFSFIDAANTPHN